jgi:hypothetical protein
MKIVKKVLVPNYKDMKLIWVEVKLHIFLSLYHLKVSGNRRGLAVLFQIKIIWYLLDMRLADPSVGIEAAGPDFRCVKRR